MSTPTPAIVSVRDVIRQCASPIQVDFQESCEILAANFTFGFDDGLDLPLVLSHLASLLTQVIDALTPETTGFTRQERLDDLNEAVTSINDMLWLITLSGPYAPPEVAGTLYDILKCAWAQYYNKPDPDEFDNI